MVTPISEIIFSGFVSKIVNNGVDTSWTKIKKVIKSKKTEYQNMESQIYNIIVNALNQITFNKFENNQDKIYQAAEKLLLGYNDIKSDDIEILRSGLRVLGENVNNDKYINFKGLIYDEIGKKENVELYHTILLWLLEQKDKYDQLEIEQLNQKLDAVLQILGTKEMKLNPQHGDIRREIKSRTQEYADKWNENMFLNDFDEWDENAGVNVKLSDVYIEDHLPHFVWRDNKNVSNNINKLLFGYIEKNIEDSNENKMLLILGQPGIGKSTLITWITATFANKLDEILVYQFASDLKNVDWQKSNISAQILDTLDLSYNDLNGKTLILDGFDEVSIGRNRKEILDKLYDDLIYKKTQKEEKRIESIKKFYLIITCRENYIRDYKEVKCKYITLKPWDKEQIKSFCAIFQEKTKCNISKYTMTRVIKNRDIFGIPLILYMVLALNICAEKEGSVVDIYDKIFSLEGGIYDRCIDNKNFADNHRIGEIKEIIHQISREIAIWMFENEPDKAYIPRKKFEEICDSVINERKKLEKKCDNVIKEQEQKSEDIKRDTLIGNYFKWKHCEGIETEELYFVHRSIYEYFVAETIYNSIKNTISKLSKKGIDEFTGNISLYLKEGQITQTINKYFCYKILKLYNISENNINIMLYQWIELAFGKMLNNGMFYSCEKMNYENIMIKETQCFINLVNILRELFNISNREYIMMDTNRKQLEKYIKYCSISYETNKEIRRDYFNLSKIFLKDINMAGVNLVNANFIDTILENTNLSRANLANSNFSGAILRNANFESAILRGADLSNADLSNANLSNADLTDANLTDAILCKTMLVGTNLAYAKLVRTNLEKAYLRGANLEGAKLEGANLYDSDLVRTILIDADLSQAMLSNVILEGAIINEMQACYLKGRCDLHDSFVLYNDKLIRYEEFYDAG